MNERQGAGLAALALLTDPVRRRLFDHVVSRHPDTVTRDQAAEAAGVSRNLAAFHLDRLVAGGLLEAGYGRVGGRSGPGAGRPSKLYLWARAEVSASVPERRYELAADILARAAGSRQARLRVHEEARRAGRAIGARSAEAGTEPSLEGLVEALAAQGFEPASASGAVRMRNCPFHSLARSHGSLVCGMNLALLEGIVEGYGASAMPRLDPRPGYCCVALG